MNDVLPFDLEERFARRIPSLPIPPGPAIVAVSGGPDSVALIALLEATREVHHHPLIVAHADHGMRADSRTAADMVNALADRFGFPFEVTELRLGADAGETSAREARYAWLETIRLRHGAGCIMTAHHADDQAETVLMRALAGSGPSGLAGMAVQSGHVVRPLLSWAHEQLIAYVAVRGLATVDDPANRDPRHLRSWLRREVLPQLRARLPEVDNSLRSLSRQARVHREAWEQVLDRLSRLDWRAEFDGASVAVTPLGDYDSPLGTALLLTAFRRAGGIVGTDRAAELLRFAQEASSGQRFDIGRGWWAERAFDRLHFVLDAKRPRPGLPVELTAPCGTMRWGAWDLAWRREPAPATMNRRGTTAWLVPAPVRLRAWREGDRVRPLRGAGHRLVVRCFQDARVPRRQRVAWPVFDDGSEIVWVPGVVRSEGLIPSPGAEALRIDAGFG